MKVFNATTRTYVDYMQRQSDGEFCKNLYFLSRSLAQWFVLRRQFKRGNILAALKIT